MARRLRIAHIIGNLETGGAQNLLLEIMRRLDRKRFDPFILYFKDPVHFAEEIANQGWECHKVHASRAYRIGEIARLARRLRIYRPDIAHTHSDFANFAGRAAAICAGVPHVLVHYQNTYEHRLTPQFRRMEARLACRTDAYIACSGGVENFLARELDLGDRPVHLMQNSIDLAPYRAAGEDRAAARRHHGIQDGVFHIVHTARLEPHKQPQQLLLALSLSTTDPSRSLGNWRVTFVGGGSMRDEFGPLLSKIDGEAEARGGEAISPRVHFVGWSREVPGWLASADAFCLVSKNEGLPLSLVEAMAAGTPTIASDIVGPREVIPDERFGLLVQSDRPQSILDALLRYRRDAAFREGVVIAARKRALEFSSESFVENLGNLYDELAASPGIASRNKIGLFAKVAMLLGLRASARSQRHAFRAGGIR